MGLIKDLVDLVAQLDESITDRKTRELLLPVKEKAHEVEKAQFHIERSHTEEIDKVKAEHAQEVNKLQSQIATLKAKLDAQQKSPQADFSSKTSGW